MSRSLKKIFVTGGTGLVGTEIVKELTLQGHEVWSLSRQPDLHRSRFENIHWVEGDLASDTFDWLNKLPTDIEAVVHAGALVQYEGKDPLSSYRRANMESTERLLKHFKPQAFVLVSSFSFLQKPLEAEITENHALAPLTPYSISKYWSEMALFQHAEAQTFRPICLRISSPVSTAFELLHPTVIKKMILSAKNTASVQILGDGLRVQNFVSTQDIAKAVRLSLNQSTASGVFNIAAKAGLSMRELANQIAHHFKTKVIQNGLDPLEQERWNISIEKAKREFDFSPQFTSKEAIESLLANL